MEHSSDEEWGNFLSMIFDLKTILAITVISSFFMGFGFLFMSSSLSNRTIVRLWVFGNFLQAIGWIVVAFLRGIIPDFISIVFGQFLVISSTILWSRSIYLLLKIKPSRFYHPLILFGLVCSIFYYTQIEPNLRIRIAILSLTYFLVLFPIGLRLLIHEGKSIYKFVSILFLSSSVLFFLRVFYQFLAKNQSNEPFTIVTPFENIFSTGSFVLSILAPIGFILITNENHLENLEESEKALNESKLKLRTVFNTLDIGITIMDNNGRMVDYNQSAELMFGFTKNRFKRFPKSWIKNKIFGPNLEPMRINELERYFSLVRDKSIQDFEFAIQNEKNEIRWFYVNSENIPSGSYGYVNSFFEITQRKKLEQDLEKAKNDAIKANQLKTQFLANMSHDIRTPMNSMIGFSEILQEKIKHGESVSDEILAIQRSGKTLVGLINDILDLARIESGYLELSKNPCDLRKLVGELNFLFSVTCKEKNIDLECKIDETVPEAVLVDGLRIRQVLLNLLGNAIKFTNKGSVSLQISSQMISEDKKTIRLEFRVTDTGRGISSEDFDSIFQPFVQKKTQLNGRQTGSGLGLAIVNRLVNLMDGEIKVSSKQGKGSIFTVVLNEISFQNDSIQKNEEKQNDRTIFENRTILLVEDVIDNRNVIKGFLRKSKIEIIEAENGLAALEVLEKRKVDLILMDIQMPIMDGKTASRFIKSNEEWKNTPIIIVSADAMREEREALAEISEEYLTKPVDKFQLFSILNIYL